MSKYGECPFCGSEDLKRVEEASSIKIDEYQIQEIVEGFLHCDTCEEEWGDESQENISKNKELAKISRVTAISTVFSNLKSRHTNITGLERQLGFAPNSIHRWKHESPSHSSLLLMKFIDHCPWLPNIAELGFDKDKTREIIAIALGNELFDEYSPFNLCTWGLEIEGKKRMFTFSEMNDAETEDSNEFITTTTSAGITLKNGTNGW